MLRDSTSNSRFCKLSSGMETLLESLLITGCRYIILLDLSRAMSLANRLKHLVLQAFKHLYFFYNY